MRQATAVMALGIALAVSTPTAAQNPHLVTYTGTRGPGVGKRVVMLAGDHEYRSEETLPALARILARHYGITCSVFFTTDRATGFIEPGSSSIAGPEALRTADLLVVFLRFQDFDDAEMRHIVEYLDQGKPVMGLRTATHAFQIQRPDATYRKYDWHGVPGYEGGFGRQVLGETWVSHYGTNHKQSSRLALAADQATHPILRGVRDVWVQSGGYTAHPIAGSTVLARGVILDGMTPDSPAARDREELPVAWTRTYRGASGQVGRVFTTTHGASEDLLNDGFRRMLVNAALWCLGLDASITATSDIGFVGPFKPSGYSFGGFVKGMRPADVAGWESAIPKPAN